MWLTSIFHLPRGYWLTLTAVVVLQPAAASTWVRTLERVLGSVLGGGVAAVIGMLARSPAEMAVLIVPLAVLTMALRRVNYTLYMLFLTPQFILIAELFQTGGEGGGDLAGLRALDSTIGAMLGLVAGYTLWPIWEVSGIRKQLSEALIATANYLETGLAPTATPEEIAAARRQAGLASNNAELSFQRVLTEPKSLPASERDAALAILTSIRGLHGVVTGMVALGAARERYREAVSDTGTVLRLLREYSKRLTVRREPGSEADDLASPMGSTSGAVARLFQEVEIIGKATARLDKQSDQAAG